MQAVVDLRRPRRLTGKERNLYADTLAWFLSEERSPPHSFVALCELFDWSPDAVRHAILGPSWATQEPVRQLRLVRRR